MTTTERHHTDIEPSTRNRATVEEQTAMHGTRSGPRTIFSGIAIAAILATACNSAVSPSPSAAQSAAASQVAVAPSVTPAPALTPAPIDTDQPGPNGGVVIRWFVGLGAGGQPQQFAAEQAFVDKFNSSDA